jgi:hypothetical protein
VVNTTSTGVVLTFTTIMRLPISVSLVSAVCVMAFVPMRARPAASARAETERAVSFSAVDGKGVPVADLAAPDLLLKENGKELPVASLKPATGPLQIVVIVDDGGSGTMRPAVARFLAATRGQAQFAIALLTPQPSKLTNFTSDDQSLVGALERIVERGRVQRDETQLIEAISWATKELRQQKGPRPAIVAMTNSGEPPTSDVGNAILADLKDSGASLNIVHISGVPFGKVMTDGTKQSGGLLLSANSTSGMSDALTRIANNLTHQYVVSYKLPEGSKPSERFELKATRQNITLLAPTRIPNK